MSDSDETVCGEENENTESSPSILSNWHQDEAVFSARQILSTQKENSSKKIMLKNNPQMEPEENSLKNNPNILREDNSLKEDDDDAGKATSVVEVSPEFPLITRGLKRKESRESQTADEAEQRLINLLTSVEDLIKDLEIQSEPKGKLNPALGAQQDAKSQLAVVQQLLVESNRENQGKRKMAMPDCGNSQELDFEKRLLIVNLAKKQRSLLEAFKRYKNLVQRLKAINDLNISPQRSGQIPESCIVLSQNSQKSKSSVSLTTSSGQRALPPDGTVQVSTKESFNVPKTIPRIVNTDVTTSGLITQGIQQGSVKFILLQNQPKNFQVLSQTQHSQFKVAATLSTTPRPQKSVISQCTTKSVPGQNAASFAERANPAAAKQLNLTQFAAQNAIMKQVPKDQRDQVTVCAASQTSSSSTNRHSNSQSSLSLRSTANHLATAIRSSENPITVSKTKSQTTQDLTHLSGMSRSSLTTNFRLSTPSTTMSTHSQTHLPSTNEVVSGSTTSFNRSGMNHNALQYSTATISASSPQHQNFLPRSRPTVREASYCMDSQSSTRPSVQATVVKQALSLDTLVKKGVLTPGENVLTAASEGKLYSASLSDKGTIISAGGEGFTSPRSWVKAILGSKRKVKNEQAWKMVSYKNMPLLDHANTTLEAAKTTQSSLPTLGNDQEHVQNHKAAHTRELINSPDALKTFFSNCRLIGISKEEILWSRKIPNTFWEKSDEEWLTDDILKLSDF